MSSRLTDLFKKSPDVESFEKSVIKLNGDFSFDENEMLNLGSAYLDRYPDRRKNRNSDEVRIGYKIAKICIVENLIEGFSNQEKDSLRRGFHKLEKLGETAKFVSTSRDREETVILINRLSKKLDQINKIISTLPKGLIRERFTGAISTLYNSLYLFRLFLEENRPGICK